MSALILGAFAAMRQAPTNPFYEAPPAKSAVAALGVEA